MPLFQKPTKPAKVSSADEAAYRRKQEEEYAKQPAWKRAITDIPMGVGQALIGNAPEKHWGEGGIADRTNILTQAAMTAAPILGMTKYLAPGRVPNVAQRKVATSDFLKEADAFGPEVSDAATRFANRYPRIAAHMSPRDMPAGVDRSRILGSVSQDEAFTPSYNRTVPLNINNISKNPIETMAHEGTHVAQILGMGKSDFNRLYQNSTAGMGYVNNPFEKSARDIGKKFSNTEALIDTGIDPKVLGKIPVRNARYELAKTMGSPPPEGSQARPFYETIRNTLEERARRKIHAR